MMELRADRYHSGVRFTALGLWLAAIAALFFLGRWLGGLLLVGGVTGFGVLVLMAAAFVAAQPVAYLAERQLIKFWPSGRAVQLDGRLLRLHQPGADKLIRLDQPLAFRRWRFEVRTRRGGHVPKGHHCLALRLAQDDQVVALYAFCSPAVMQDLAARFAFYQVRGAKETGAPAGDTAGRDPAYLEAENDRWVFGAELEAGDFERLLTAVAPGVTGFAERPAG